MTRTELLAPWALAALMTFTATRTPVSRSCGLDGRSGMDQTYGASLGHSPDMNLPPHESSVPLQRVPPISNAKWGVDSEGISTVKVRHL